MTTLYTTPPPGRLLIQARQLIAAWDYGAAVRLLAAGHARPGRHTPDDTAEQIAVLYLHALREAGQTAAGVALGEALFDDTTNRHGLTRPVTVQVLAVLGELYHDLGRLDDADDCYHLVAASRTDAHHLAGPAVRRTTANRALLRYDRGHHRAAVAELEAAHATLHRFGGAAHPDTLRTAADLAGLLHRHGRTAHAHTLLTGSLAAARAGLADQHPLTALLAHDLAALRHTAGGGPAQAIPTTALSTVPTARTGPSSTGWSRPGPQPGSRPAGRSRWSVPRPAVPAGAGVSR